MIVHVVLFRPRPDVSDAEREGLLESMRVAAREVPSVRGFRIGAHLDPPPTYVLGGFPSFPWIALLEFDDTAGLQAYLTHPLHRDLGTRFNATAEAALIYDYEIAEAMK
ncbi:hypothetical protein TBR22_A53370 [Luteitalea sp. TBR-22]|nr:hypothetical protein TBR22_A53370 [Luteitalea sp. TBR-22]